MNWFEHLIQHFYCTNKCLSVLLLEKIWATISTNHNWQVSRNAYCADNHERHSLFCTSEQEWVLRTCNRDVFLSLLHTHTHTQTCSPTEKSHRMLEVAREWKNESLLWAISLTLIIASQLLAPADAGYSAADTAAASLCLTHASNKYTYMHSDTHWTYCSNCRKTCIHTQNLEWLQVSTCCMHITHPHNTEVSQLPNERPD